MSQQKKLEKVLDLLLSEDQNQAAELLHQIIVEKARTIYERIVEEEEIDAPIEEGVHGGMTLAERAGYYKRRLKYQENDSYSPVISKRKLAKMNDREKLQYLKDKLFRK